MIPFIRLMARGIGACPYGQWGRTGTDHRPLLLGGEGILMIDFRSNNR